MTEPKKKPAAAARDWKHAFFAALAETSNVARAAKAAGVATSTVYATRRQSRDFARRWRSALCEGYDNLEMELLARLRGGEIKRAASARTGVRTFDNPTAFRLLAVHRDAVDKERAGRANTTAAELRASIERKVAALKARVLAREEAERQQAEAQGAAGHGE